MKLIKNKRIIESILLLSISFLIGQIVFFHWLPENLDFLSKNYLPYGFNLWIAIRVGTPSVFFSFIIISIQMFLAGSTDNNDLLYLFTLAIFSGTTSIYIVKVKRKLDNLQLKDNALNAAANGILITNRSGKIEWANQAFGDLTGYSLDEVYSLNPKVILRSGKQNSQFYKTMWDTILYKKVWHGELINRRKDGSFYDEEMTITPVTDRDGIISHFIAVKQDITKRKQTESELRIAATVFNAQEGMVITNSDGIILKVNHAFTRITGYEPDEVIGKSPRMFRSGIHDEEFYATMWKSIHQTKAWQGEIWNRRKNGEIYPQWLTITAVVEENNVISRYVATVTDISERKATEELISRLAFYDPLTQLPNRRILEERLKKGIITNEKFGGKMAAMMLDLDKFKAVNDNYGHLVGDELLKQVALRIKSRLRDVDLVSRMGGDEFFILIENLNQINDTVLIAKEIIAILSQPFTLLEKYTVQIGASIGICIHPDNGDNPALIMNHADIALYNAKERGRGCFSFFNENLLLEKLQTNRN